MQRARTRAVEVPRGHELAILPDQQAPHARNIFSCSESVGERLFRIRGVKGQILCFGAAGEDAEHQCCRRKVSSYHVCSYLAHTIDSDV